MQLKRSVAADNDLIEIYQYTFETYGKAKAESYFAELIDAMVIISESPYIYRERTEFVSPVRIARAGQHLVVYSIEENFVLVLRVLHSSMEIEEQLSGS